MIPARLAALLVSALAAAATAPAFASERLTLNLGGAALLPRADERLEMTGNALAHPVLAYPGLLPKGLSPTGAIPRDAEAFQTPPPLLETPEEMSQLLGLEYALSEDGLWQSYLGARLTERPLRGVVEAERARALQFSAGIGYQRESRLMLYGGWRYVEPEVGRLGARDMETETSAHLIEGGFRLKF